MSDPHSDDWIAVAEVVRPHGVRGELRVRLYNPDSEALMEPCQVQLRVPNGSSSLVQVYPRQASAGIVLIRMEGLNDRDAAEQLRGAVLHVQRSELPELQEGEFYINDVLGARAELVDGSPVGTVVDFRSYPTTDVLVIEGGGKQYEVPLLDDFVESVDTTAKRVVLKTVDELETT